KTRMERILVHQKGQRSVRLPKTMLSLPKLTRQLPTSLQQRSPIQEVHLCAIDATVTISRNISAVSVLTVGSQVILPMFVGLLKIAQFRTLLNKLLSNRVRLHDQTTYQVLVITVGI
ncbi:hypothetical protein NP026_23555, partial [Salmonella enterica]|nr:hypothetical protein [Salmonella enterica]